MTTRPAAVAGLFYPQDSEDLKQQINALLNQSKVEIQPRLPRALIVPHAGYIYSGLSAAYAYNTLNNDKSNASSNQQSINRVILLGPAHRVAVDTMAVPTTSAFVTPLGEVPLDSDEINRLLNKQLVFSSDLAHQQEHSLEVQLPFLQTILPAFKLLPIVVGQCSIELVSTLLNHYINDPTNLIIISTDLSHFLEYLVAQRQDQETSHKIMNFQYNQFNANDACGRIPLAGMLKSAQEANLSITQLDIRNSGDTAGDKQRVVGYGAWSLYAKL